MIHFRKLDDLPNAPESVCFHWQIEYWDGEVPYPAGIAWVSAYKQPPGAWHEAILEYILVVDGYRRQGVATKLLRAIRDRWPTVFFAPATDDGELFLAEQGAMQYLEDVGV